MKRGFWLLLGLIVAFIGVSRLFSKDTIFHNPASAQAASQGTPGAAHRVGEVIRVMTLGSSVAEGWSDKSGGGYLKRAFAQLSSDGMAQYQIFSRSYAGNGVRQVIHSYPKWLAKDKPQIVVISWGALDDLHDKTPMIDVEQQVVSEINQALDAHAVVMVVTPPITRASYTNYATQETDYVNHEIAAAKSVKSSNVYIFDVFGQMKDYIKSHHETYVPYMADGWHPNSAGHKLAGELLLSDMEKQFGTSPIVFGNSH